jgi:hypothetical protein
MTVYPKAAQFIHKHDIKALLLSVRESAIGHTIVQVAHDAGIPVISWQHGGAGYGYHPLMPYIEYLGSDIHLVFGEGVAENYRWINDQIGLVDAPTIVAVGSSSLDRVRQSVNQPCSRGSGRTVLYVTTLYLQNLYTISAITDPIAFDRNLWEVQKAVINIAKRHPADRFLIKLHPTHKSRQPLLDYIQHHRVPNIGLIVHEKDLAECLRGADIMVFDLVSTGILQALQLKAPLFVFTGLCPVDEKARALLEQRACVYEEEREFVSAIDWYLKGQSEESRDRTNTSFITQYGTYKTDGLGAERAAGIIKRIIMGGL